MVEIPGATRAAATPTTFEALGKKKGTKPEKDPVLELLKGVVDKSKETKKPTVIKKNNPASGKGKTGPKRPEPGGGGSAKDN